MKKIVVSFQRNSVLTVLSVVLLSATSVSVQRQKHFPWKHAGLTETQAAAHLLSRFTYGATPEQIEAVVSYGLENWFTDQLAARKADEALERKLEQYPSLRLGNGEITRIYPRNAQLVRMAITDQAIDKNAVQQNSPEYRARIKSYMDEKGYKPQRELFQDFIGAKVLRAVYTENQLQEVMADFWFNHFNVSLSKNQCASFIPAYERDVIRPGALGKFEDLLLATARSPAMLTYLDNFISASALPDAVMEIQQRMNPARMPRKRGLNENYAREVMELHTLGVDGGYTQKDVTEAARILTGWTLFPMGGYGENYVRNRLESGDGERLRKQGFYRNGDFVFNPQRHDKGRKTVLGKTFGPDGGYKEGVELLQMLAAHPSTARFISRKLAVRFVCDTPDQALVDRMAAVFSKTDGDIPAVLTAMVSAPEFWNEKAVREKIKSPFELAISAVRSLDATVENPSGLINWISRMGEKKYYYVAPTGFPDHGQFWINTGSLLSRMNFALALAANSVPGVKVDLPAITGKREPESAAQALELYVQAVLPERDPEKTLRQLKPMLNDPQLARKVNRASSEAGGATTENTTRVPVLAQVAGLVIGSPEYQRR